MRISGTVTLALLAVLGLAPAATAQQGTRSVGGGPSTQFNTNLPSYGINQTLGGNVGFTTADRFMRGPSEAAASYLYQGGMQINLMTGGWRPPTMADLAVGPGLGPLVGLKFRTIDSLNFERRARFAKLRETTLALAERIRHADEASLGQVSLGFRQFMFPFPILDQPSCGYGFFSRLDLVGGGSVDPESLLGPFTQEVQQSLGEARFLDAAQAMLLGRPLPQGMAIDQFYDTQVAALGNYLFNNGKYADAATAWAVLVERDATNATAARALGLCLLAGNQMKRAAAQLRRSLALAPGWPDNLRVAGSNLQDVFPQAKDLVAIRDELKAQLAKQPDDPDLNFLQGFVDLFHGNWTAAEERLSRLGAADEVARGLVARLKGQGVADTVRRPAQSALRRAAEELTGLEEPAMSPEARERLVAVLRAGPSTYEDYMRLGDFRFFMGDFTQAGEAYRAAHKAKPEDPFALFALVHGCFANGEYRQASRYLVSAMALEPNWGLYEFRLQEFYGDAGEYHRQVKDLTRQLELRSGGTELRFLLAYVYYFSGRYGDAADLLSGVLRIEPSFSQANTLLRLARLQG